jgi:hypothetical protein
VGGIFFNFLFRYLFSDLKNFDVIFRKVNFVNEYKSFWVEILCMPEESA